MDIQMPGLDGPAAAGLIRAAAGPTQSAPILAFSANVELPPGRDAPEGFDGYLRKPFTRDDLVRAAAAALGARSAEAAGSEG